MRKLLALVLFSTLSLSAASAATYPVDDVIGHVIEGEPRLLEAFSTAYDETWLERFASPSVQKDLNALHGQDLLAALPLEDIVMSGEAGRYMLRDRSSGLVITIWLDQDGLVEALSFNNQGL